VHTNKHLTIVEIPAAKRIPIAQYLAHLKTVFPSNLTFDAAALLVVSAVLLLLVFRLLVLVTAVLVQSVFPLH